MKQLRRSFFIFACLWVAAVCVSTSAYSQVLYGTLVGTITDQSDAVVPKAEVTATNGATNQTYRAVTDDQGRYSIPDVLAGKYTIKVSATGFRSLVQNDFNVSINTVNRADLKLAVGQVSEQVTVEGQAVALQTDKSDVHSEISSVAIENLPLTKYRNYQQLINLVPGSTPASFQNSITDTPGKALQTHINGANAQSNNTRLDGAQNINVWLPHHVAYVAPSDTIETVNVSTDAFDAEQGMAGGAAVTVITKSGTNDLHGSAFTFYDNQHLKTRNFFQAPGTEKPFGTTLISGAHSRRTDHQESLVFLWRLGAHRRTQRSRCDSHLAHCRSAAGNFSAYNTKILRSEYRKSRWQRPDSIHQQHHSGQPYQSAGSGSAKPVAGDKLGLARPTIISSPALRTGPQSVRHEGQLPGDRQADGLGQVQPYGCKCSGAAVTGCSQWSWHRR